MSKYDCITVCVVSVALAFVFSVMCVVIPLRDSVNNLTDALSQPGISDRMEMDSLTITSLDGVSVTIDNLDVTMNSRLLDIFLGAAAVESGR